jgi:hypothetical protein
MSNLKYIKLFEAFESIKLTKTLGFINKGSNATFISQLKTIASKLDFPVSKYSDDYFQYLPFKKALDLNQNLEDEPCDATSKGEFPQYSIDGETCQEGKLKRMWGSRPRSVVCPACNGTGIKKRTTFEIKWIKFWFNKDGNYVTTTGTDGKVRGQRKNSSGFNLPDVSDIRETSQEIVDYIEITSIQSSSEFSKFPSGTFIKITIDTKDLIGRIWNARSGSFIIQNRADGSASDENSDWKMYGRNSWNVSSGDYRGTPIILVPKNVEFSKEDEQIDPYTWNAPLDLGRYGMSLSNDSNVKGKLTDAHFALVLDFLELKKSGFKTKSEVGEERGEQKLGATALLRDEDIKKANISRYIDTISKNIKISSDFSNMNNMVFRFFGLSNFGFYILRGRHFSDFNNLITHIYRFLKETDESKKSDYYETIISIIKMKSEANTNFNIEVDKNIKDFYKNNTSEGKVKMMKKLEEINKAIIDKFKSFKIENIEDLEVFYQKIESVRNIWRNSERFENSRKLYYVVENLGDEYRINRYMNEIYDSNVDTIIEELDRFIKVIQKM